VYGGVLKADGANLYQSPLMAQVLNRDRLESTWGINAVVLKSPWSKSPSLDDMLADHEHTLVLNRFYRVAGENRPATPTECRLAYTSDALLVAFRCQESDMSFSHANLDEDWWPDANWHSLRGLPSGSNNWPPYPDEMDFLIQPDTSIPRITNLRRHHRA